MVSGMSRKILTYPEPILREKSKKIENLDEEISQIADSMLEAMFSADGVGLAAPQIGVPLRLITINVQGDFQILVNPTVIEVSEERSKDIEGCLSIPGIDSQVQRPLKVLVSGIDLLDEKEKRLEREGLAARVLLHEIDHLNGTLYIDYLGEAKRTQMLKEYKKIKEQV